MIPALRMELLELVEMMAERGLAVDHTMIMRWVERFMPEGTRGGLGVWMRPHVMIFRRQGQYGYQSVRRGGQRQSVCLSPKNVAQRPRSARTSGTIHLVMVSM